MMEFVIINQSDLDISELEPLIQSLVSFGQDRLGFQDPPSLFLKSDSENASDFLGKTGFYDPMEQEITAFVDQRHPKDILRSISHELVHHAQNCRGEFDEDMELGEGYAQKNPHLREMEKEAYLEGNLILRDWEDNHKKQLQESIYYDSGYIIEENKRMSTKNWKDRELNTLLMEKWGYKMPTNERVGHSCANHVKENLTGRKGRPINHTLLENGAVTHYTVEFLNEIVENIPVDKLTILESHDHEHEAVREDYEHDESKTRTMYEQDVVPPGGDSDSHVVQSGDTFYDLQKAGRFGDFTTDDVLAYHAMQTGVTLDPKKLQVDTEILLPPPGWSVKAPVKEQEAPGTADVDIPELPTLTPGSGTATEIPDLPPTPPTGTGIEMPDDISPVEEEVKAPAAMAGRTGGIQVGIKESQEKFRKVVREALRKRLKR